MAGAAPVEVEVKEIPEGQTVGGFGDVKILEEVLIGDEGRTRPFWFSKGTEPPAVGEVVKGWWNTVKSGRNEGDRYFRRADDDNGAQRRSKGAQGTFTDDDTQESIQRQKTADIAANLMTGLDFGWKREAFPADFDFVFDKVYARISERGE